MGEKLNKEEAPSGFQLLLLHSTCNFEAPDEKKVSSGEILKLLIGGLMFKALALEKCASLSNEETHKQLNKDSPIKGSYSFFLSKKKTLAIQFKVVNPICFHFRP
ncbi:uncharacterized protein G2W53_006193 [Senna tora]|uniref:Uncharacterized protein n=1 Tax=Senna tora TaxID=362788 RepID=A0A834X3L5_9FABA|nr:uncharacterized protein G2W53_006193 [Senna tora]